MRNDYADLIDMPHHVSDSHPRLSMEQRAAQFMPFAALTGFEEKIEETSEETVSRVLAGERGSLFDEDS
ncbi:MAG: hypothetical protein MJ185_03470 [Treponema sp.]|nr:hypothetical protein [Treponema sp.]